MRTGAYSQEARWRLAQAIVDARKADGHPHRPTFYKAAGISKRSLEAAESLERDAPSVGETVLHAIGRTLSNWTKDTPRDILEGRPIPPIPEDVPRDSARPAEPRVIVMDAHALSDLHEILTAPWKQITRIAEMIEAVSGPAAAEKFLADAFAARQKNASVEERDIEPAPDVDRDPQ